MGLKEFFGFKKPKERKYDSGSKSDRTSGWITGGGDANTQISSSLTTLRERSRDLRRNNAFAHKAIEVITNNVVGKGIQTRIQGPGDEFLQRQWDAWTKKIDYDGRLNMSGLQRLLMDSTTESGEVLIRKRIVNEEFPIQYQVLESDFLSTSELDGIQSNGNVIIQGVEFNKSGKISSYHLYESHPGSLVTSVASIKTNPIPARNVYHIFRQERPGQVRGVPWMAPVMLRLRDLDDFEDAQLVRQKIAACFTAFVHDINAEVECEDESDFGEKLSPGTIEELPPGKSISFANPPSVENYKEFTSAQKHAIAAGIGISYESLTGDLSEVNFSSARMGWLEMDRNFQSWRESILIHQFLNRVVEDFKEMMMIKGVNISDQVKFIHIAPKRQMIDPTKEIPASINAIRAGLTSLSAEISASGEDPDTVLEQWAKDQDKTESLGLILKTNPKYTSDSGKTQEVANNEQEEQD